MKFIKKTTYYSDTVYEFNLPSGWSCPGACECLVKVERESGKFHNKSTSYRCYSAMAERFPSARAHRWANWDGIKAGEIPKLPKNCLRVRVHASGDFFNQEYFDMWLQICRDNPDVEFWAFTKSLTYWVNRMDVIPSNMVLTASVGGKHDALIEKYNLKFALVCGNLLEAVERGLPVDNNDDLARMPDVCFALLDNHKNSKAIK